MEFDITKINRIVVKVGTSTLAHPTGRLNIRRVETLVKVLADIKNTGKEIVLVSSGAIGVGAGVLGMKERPRETTAKQAAAAVGQCELMNVYGEEFAKYGHKVAQILLTKDVVNNEKSNINAQNTFMKLLEYGALPIVNENDTISTEEAEFGDNDNLSAVVALLSKAELLIILTDIDGVYSANPREVKDAERIAVLTDIDGAMKNAGGAGTQHGTGGMITKLQAAKTAQAGGIHTIIASGGNPENLYDILEGKQIGTLI